MKSKHVGIRPTGDLTPYGAGSYKHKYYFEESTGKVWSQRELESGCGGVLTNPKCKIVHGTVLHYCKHCDEWFAVKQFELVEV